MSGGTSCVNTPCCYCDQLHLPSNCSVVSQVEARKQADREHEAYALYTKLREILSHGSFNLRKFTTNAPSLQSLVDSQEASLKNPQGTKPHANVVVISRIGGIYDPLGFLSPVTVRFKILMQKLCENKLGWERPAVRWGIASQVEKTG